MKKKIFNNLIVDNVYCLYLEEFQERKINSIQHFKEKNIPVEMFRGTYYPNEGSFGCKMSHLKIIEDAKNKNYENILICEDDVLFEEEFPININIPNDFGMFYLSYYDYENLSILDDDSDKYMKDSKFNLIRLFYTRSTISYVVNKKVFDDILNVKQHNTHYNKFIDMFYAHQIQNKYKCYGLYPLPCTIRCSNSTIINNKKENEEKIRQDIIDKSNITFNKIRDSEFYDLVKKGNPFHYKKKLFLNGFKK